MEHSSSLPAAQDIALANEAAIVGVAEQFCKREFGDEALSATLISKSSAVIDGDTRRGVFLLMHNYGFVGVEAPIKEDGSLGEMICRKV